MVNLIEVKNVSKSFCEGRQKKSVLQGINLNIEQGEFVVLKGVNGSGKTSLLNIILGITKPNQGQVVLFNESPENPSAKNSVGVVLQKVSVPKNITVKELINLFCSYYKHSKTTEEIIKAVNLEKKQKSYAAKLCGGEEQRLHFALALTGNPKLLILDEPTRNLDEEGCLEFWNQIKQCRDQGITLLMVTNNKADWQELDKLATRAITLENGSVKEDKILQEINKTPLEFNSPESNNKTSALIEQIKFEAIQLIRNPGYLLGILAFSALILLFPNVDQSTLITFSGVALVTFAFQRIGERIATERIEGWLKLLRVTPLSSTTYLAAKICSSFLICVLILSIIFALGIMRFDIDFSLGEWLILFLGLIVGITPFMMLGIFLGYLIKPKVLNSVTGIVIVVAILSASDKLVGDNITLKDLIAFSPSYHYAELAAKLAGIQEGHTLLIVNVFVLAWYAILLYLLANWAFQQDEVLD